MLIIRSYIIYTLQLAPAADVRTVYIYMCVCVCVRARYACVCCATPHKEIVYTEIRVGCPPNVTLFKAEFGFRV